MRGRSRRARRMERHHNMHKARPLNLVSLMDIFTILVFFLLINSSSAPQLPNQKELTLPSSVTRNVPEDSLVLAITPERILLQGREVLKLTDLNESAVALIPQLQEELTYHGKNRQLMASPSGEGRAITIMGDENVSYGLLDRILQTCQAANYTRIAFAAQQKSRAGTGD